MSHRNQGSMVQVNHYLVGEVKQPLLDSNCNCFGTVSDFQFLDDFVYMIARRVGADVER